MKENSVGLVITVIFESQTMEATGEPELDVDRLMNAIREAAANRGFEIAAVSEPTPSFPLREPLAKQGSVTSSAPSLLKSTSSAEASARLGSNFTLAPDFKTRSSDQYHVNDLLQYHDRDFVRHAYHAILKREPDTDGLQNNLKMLASGHFNKIDILASLRYSEEGKMYGVEVAGLRIPATVRALERIPLIGYLLQTLIGVVRLPAMIRSQRQFQAYIISQQLNIADRLTETTEQIARHIDEYEVTSAGLANQQVQLDAVEHSLRNNVVPCLVEGQEQTTQVQMKLALFSDRLKNLSQTLLQTRTELEDQGRVVNDLNSKAIAPGQVALPKTKLSSATERREWDELYASFEEQFRGSVAEVEERLGYYLPFIQELKPNDQILDLGSGRGDWLKLLRKEGFTARGIEINSVLVESSRQNGLDVVEGEMLRYLADVRADSLDVITGFHLIEHISNESLIRLINEVKRTLRPGGLFMIETPSPENLVVAACNFWADPTHLKPVYPHTLTFILRSKGFVNLRLQFLHAVDDSPFLDGRAGFPELNTWFYGPRDYAVVACNG